MTKHPTWNDYACDVKATIDSLPGDSKESSRRFQIVLESHLVARSKHDYLGTFSDWYYMIKSKASAMEANAAA